MSKEEQEIPPASDDETPCNMTERGKRWALTCTRPLGHDGDHVGHGSDDKELGRWPQ